MCINGYFNKQIRCCNSQPFLQELLSDEELRNFKSMKCWIQHEHNSVIKSAIQITNLSSSWDINQNYVTIRSVTASFKRGNLSAIIGPVGCGKVQILFISHFIYRVRHKGFFLVE